ncbi:hypothetical protein CN565_18770 [Bacillus pseudomycoides]|nr:hypothetical protein [Bacillus pseudomycoides]PEP40000.1 hypothetical protein CN565_18770 [Bacillus pseudomycoides]PFY53422.1 hypothetical protein COL49_26735 [Bacillus pseudomycoides]PGE09530.1 hypothetical protein COM51_26590 [Bacillus pseudomycoides]
MNKETELNSILKLKTGLPTSYMIFIFGLQKITPISIHWEDTNLPSRIDLDGFGDLRKGMTIEETYRTLQREASSGRTNSINNQRTIEYEFRSGTGSKSI